MCSIVEDFGMSEAAIDAAVARVLVAVALEQDERRAA